MVVLRGLISADDIIVKIEFEVDTLCSQALRVCFHWEIFPATLPRIHGVGKVNTQNHRGVLHIALSNSMDYVQYPEEIQAVVPSPIFCSLNTKDRQ